MAEWLCSGLQSRSRRFDSGFSLQFRINMELNNINKQEVYDDDFSIHDLIEIIINSKRMFLNLFAIFFLAGCAYSFFSSNVYTSDSLLTIVDDSEAGGTGFQQMSNRYGGLASLVGVPLTNSSNAKSDLIIATIKSRTFFDHISSIPGIYPSLVAAKSYDPASKKLTLDSSIYDSSKDIWVAEKPSTASSHYAYFLKKLSISADKKTGFINLNFTHASPEFAFQMVQTIINEANNLTRRQHILQADQALKFLNSEQLKTADIGTKESIATLVNAQFKVKMLANVREDYIIRAIDPPVISGWPSAPDRPRIIILTTLAGLIFGFFIALYRLYFSQSKKTRKVA